MTGELRLRLAPGDRGLEEGQQALHAFLEKGGADARGIYYAELVFDELVTNVIKYSYRGDTSRPIDVSAAFDGDDIVLRFEDEGPEFNPLDVAAPNHPKTLDEARTGGMGLELVRKVSRALDYERIEQRNRLTARVARVS